MKQLYQVQTSYFTCEIATGDEDGMAVQRVVEAAPIMAWAIGKPLSQIIAWVEKKHGKIVGEKCP